VAGNSAQLAKATLQRLASSRLEPTPDNYLKAWIESGGGAASRAAPDADGRTWGGLIEQIVRGLERGGRQWTAARKKEGVQRVLASSRADANRLRERLQQLVASWERDTLDVAVDTRSASRRRQPGACPRCRAGRRRRTEAHRAGARAVRAPPPADGRTRTPRA
jgi:diguanylate cyclase